MEVTFLSVLGLGFLLGIKHAMEPDHVVAVSTIAAESKKLWRAALTGAFWGIGHTLTLFVVGMGFLLLKLEMPQSWALSFEFGIGIMLVYLGVSSLWARRKKAGKVHTHVHLHGGKRHVHFHRHNRAVKVHNHGHDVSHWRSLAIGVLHGMAGSAGMVVMTMAVATTMWEAATYVLIFGVGTVVGMLLSTTLIGLPFVAAAGRKAIHAPLVRAAGAVSACFGFYYMYEIGVGEGLFRLWLS